VLLAERESDELPAVSVRYRSLKISVVQQIKVFSSLLFAAVYFRPPQAVLFLGT
jgi:hypothetical protein